jgi:hypothetical protein
MKLKKIVGFGDSWMFGDELLSPDLKRTDADAHACWIQNIPYREKHCFLGLLGEHYGVPVENYGHPGGSFQSMIWTFLWWLRYEPSFDECLVLCCLTEADRVSFYWPDYAKSGTHAEWDKFVHSTWVNHGSSTIPESYYDLTKRYIALTHCQELSSYNYQQAVTLFDGVAARHGFPLLQFHTAQPPLDLDIPSLIWPKSNLIRFFLDHHNNQDRKWYMPNGHPNEMGHTIIRDLLIPEIDCVTMSE